VRESLRAIWRELRYPLCLTTGFSLAFAAQGLTMNDPRGYTLACEILSPLICTLPIAMICAVLSLPARFGTGGSWGRWFRVFALVFLAGGALHFAGVFYGERIVKPRALQTIQQLIEEGKIPPPFLLTDNTPPEYTDGYRDGFQSGRSAVNSEVKFTKDASQYQSAPAYKQGWDDGFVLGQAREEAFQRGIR